MGSKRGAPFPSPSTECCMCGDRGLSRELIRCKLCQFRYQHKYCSDLYPKAESYRLCNWCLRVEGGKSVAATNTSSSISSPTSGDNNNNNNNNNSGGGNSSNGSSNSGVKLQRGPFSMLLSKPVKKQRSPERPSPAGVIRPMKSEEISSNVGRTRQGFRGKMRRYKLLEEVSSL